MSTRRRELLAIAADLFAEQGYAKVTVDDIGRAAGVSGPALYHHFDGKEALLGEMLVGISEYLLDGGRAVLARHLDHHVDHHNEHHDEYTDDAAIEGLIAFHAEFAVDQRSLITVHFRDLLYARADDAARVRSVQHEYVDLWTRALRRRFPDVGEATALAAVHATFGLINSTPHSARLPRDQMLTLLIEMAEAALLATMRH